VVIQGLQAILGELWFECVSTLVEFFMRGRFEVYADKQTLRIWKGHWKHTFALLPRPGIVEPIANLLHVEIGLMSDDVQFPGTCIAC
jgi:hypothetical protein